MWGRDTVNVKYKRAIPRINSKIAKRANIMACFVWTFTFSFCVCVILPSFFFCLFLSFFVFLYVCVWVSSLFFLSVYLSWSLCVCVPTRVTLNVICICLLFHFLFFVCFFFSLSRLDNYNPNFAMKYDKKLKKILVFRMFWQICVFVVFLTMQHG